MLQSPDSHLYQVDKPDNNRRFQTGLHSGIGIHNYPTLRQQKECLW